MELWITTNRDDAVLGDGAKAELPESLALRLKDLASDGLLAGYLEGESLRLTWVEALALLDSEQLDMLDAPHEALPNSLSIDGRELLLEAIHHTAPPPLTTLRLRAKVQGRPGQPGFALPVVWRNARSVTVSAPDVRGGWVFEGGAPRSRLSLRQYTTLTQARAQAEQAASARVATERMRADDFRRIGALQAWTQPKHGEEDTAVELDPFLTRQEVTTVDRVAPRIERVAPGVFQVRPEVDGVDQQYLEDRFYNVGSRPLTESVDEVPSADGRRGRVVYTDRAEAAIGKLRSIPKLDPKGLAQALSEPERFFGPDVATDKFCERVLGLGPYVRRVSPVLKEIEGRSWWEWSGAARLDALNAEAPSALLDLSTPEGVTALEEAIAEAEQAGVGYIPAPDGEGVIELSQTLREQVAAARQVLIEGVVPAPHPASQPPKASAEAPDADKRSGREVLLVKDNIDELTFDPFRAALFRSVPRVRVGALEGLAPNVKLKAYQVEGVEWLASLYAAPEGVHSWRGALLADDMGLGKTLQVLAFLAWRRASAARTPSGAEKPGPHLVVAPVGLLENWRKEAAKFFGTSLESLVVIMGRHLDKRPETAAATLGAHHIVLTSYETLRRNEQAFARVAWDIVVLDEAQKAKNPGADIARALRTVPARFRLAMTGTPVENTLQELWAIVDWAMPGLLGSLKDFADTYIKPLRAGLDHAGQVALVRMLHERIGFGFMRRHKADLKDELPKVIHHRTPVPMSAEQQAAYTRIITGADIAPGGKDTGPLGKLQRLFNVTAHPRMHVGRIEPLPLPAEVSFPKVEALCQVLDGALAAGEKVLVFAKLKLVQAWLAALIQARYHVPVAVINGDMNDSAERMRRVDAFSEKPGFGALVLAPRAAGVGLTITAANHVVHYMREWNPAVENQATDRAYRIGQSRNVHVHALICAAKPPNITVDEELDALLESKRALMASFVIPISGFDLTPEAFSSVN